MRRVPAFGVLAAAGVALVVLVLALLFLVPARDTYIFLPDRAKPVAQLVEVQGERAAREGAGGAGIYFVDIVVRRATLLERFFPWIHDGAELVPADQLNPTGISERVRRQGSLREMSRSQRIAAAVAFRALGYPVETRHSGVLVDLVVPGRPAAGKLEAGDVIVAVDGRPVRRPVELRRALGRVGAGNRATLRLGGDAPRTVQLIPERDGRSGRPVVGVIVEQAVEITLPRRVPIDVGDVGGPSAGLAFALDIVDELGRDVDRGLRVAATGELQVDGTVLPIGGVAQKTIGARRADVDVFVVPAGENADEARRQAGGLRILPVRSFQQALQKLSTLSATRENAGKEAFSKVPEIARFST